MALTKVSTNGVKDDAITAAKTSGVQPTISSNADNRLITGSDTTNTLNAESSLFYDGDKLGIGTTSPSRKLHVASSFIRVDDGYGLDTSGATEKVVLDAGFIGLTVASGEKARLTSTGLGLGTTSPTHPIDVHASGTEMARFQGANNARLKLRNSTNNIFLAYTDSGDTFQLGTNGQNPRVTITDTGKVGVNMTNPDDTLDVNGTFQVSSNAYFSNQYVSGGIYIGGTGTNNYFYDYEKGTFTPRFHGQGNNNTITTSTNIGEYVRIGRLVYVKIRVIFTNRNGANSGLAMDGLPFSNAGNHTTTNIGRWANVQNHSVVGAFVGYMGDGSQEITFNSLTSTGVSSSDVNQTTDTTTVMLSFSYPVWSG